MIENPSFDIVKREFVISNESVIIQYLSSLTDSLIINDLVRSIIECKNIENLESCLINGSITTSSDSKEITTCLYAGNCIVSTSHKTWIIETRSYPNRGISEPETEKSIRGSKDGFNENIITNVGLIRRRIRSNNLIINIHRVGSISKTDLCVCYMNNNVNKKVLNFINDRIAKITTDDLVMSDRALEELVFDQGYNPYPKIRYTERPDIVAAHIVKGYIAIIVDTSASVILCPTTLFETLEHVEEYRQTPIIGSFIRMIRYFAIFLSVYLVPIWLLVIENLGINNTLFVIPKEISLQTIVFQVLIVELSIEFLRIATIHTPTQLASATGLIAAILLGQFAVELGLFIPEILIYCAIGNVGHFATPNYEISLANKVVKLIFIIAIGLFSKMGFIVSNFLFILFLMTMKSCGMHYLYPLVPYNRKALLNAIIRKPKSN